MKRTTRLEAERKSLGLFIFSIPLTNSPAIFTKVINSLAKVYWHLKQPSSKIVPPERSIQSGGFMILRTLVTKRRFTQACFVLLGLLWIDHHSWLSAQPVESPKQDRSSPPNIIYILADDLGYGEVGCYGQTKISTPSLDQLAREGMRFTRHYSGAPVCAPSRCVLLTGRHLGHSVIRDNGEVKPEGQRPIPTDTVTIAEVLSEAGYRTAAIGKWGLGPPGSEGDPNRQGFDHFFGYNCQREAHRFYPKHLWRNQERVVLEGNLEDPKTQYSHDLLTLEALWFLRSAARGPDPFFLYLPYTIPHVDLSVPEDSMEPYYGELGDEQPYDGSKGYCTHPTPRSAYAGMISRLDRDVGRILETVRALGLDKNTLVIFSSDNGPTYAGGVEPKYFESSGGLRGLKGSAWEGGLRVPMIAWWPGKIEAGTTSDHRSAFWDIFPTLCELAGVTREYQTEGISLLPTLQGREQPRHAYLAWEFHGYGGIQAVLLAEDETREWKGVRTRCYRAPDGPIKLFDLRSDPTESKNLAPSHPDVVAQIEKILREDRSPSVVYPRWNYQREVQK